MSTQSPTRAEQWQLLAKQYRQRLNAAWWLQSFVPWFIGSGLVSFGGILYLRSQGVAMQPAWLVGGGVGLLAALAGGTYWHSRKKFLPAEESFIQLEVKLRLHNALTAAAAGVRTWPEVPAAALKAAAPQWNWRWLALPKLAVTTCLVAAFLIPVSVPESAHAKPLPPSAVQQTEQMLELLAKEDAARKEDLQKFKEQVDALKEKPVEEWYHHAGMEAADNLRDSVENAAGGLSQNMQKAEKALGSLMEEQDTPEANEKEREQAAQDLASAVEGLKSGALQPNESLLNKLKGLNPKELTQGMSKEQADQLREQLKKAAKACEDCKGKGKGKGDGQNPGGNGGEPSEEDDLRKQLADGNGEDGGDGKKGQEGAGPPTRGPGTVDLNLAKKASELENGQFKKEQTHDLNNLKSGDLLGTSDGQHNLDKAALGPLSGGAATQGDGGNATWRDELTPNEKQVIERFFK